MADENGGIELPDVATSGIAILWDDKAQAIANIQFDPKVFRSFGMVLSVLRLACESIELQRKAQQMENLHKQMQEQHAAQQLHQQLMGRR